MNGIKNIFFSFLFSVAANSTVAQVNLTQGLVAYYPFNGNANDVSGNGNNPVFNNATLTTDRNGIANSAYHFNGIDNYMKVANAPSLNMGNTLSISVWVRVTGFYYGLCHGNNILQKGDSDVLAGIYFLRFSDLGSTNQCLVGTIPDTTKELHYASHSSYLNNTYVDKNNWHLITAVATGDSSKIYIDCKMVSASPQMSSGFSNTHDLFIGAMNNSQYPNWLNGDLDELRIYNRALNDNEIRALSDCGSPNCQGSVVLNSRDRITPPPPIKQYFPATGFTWETWFNSSYYANNSTSLNTRNKLMALLDAPNCQDIVLGFGWPQVAQQNELCFVVDGPNGCADRDNTPCKYLPVGGFAPNTWYHVAGVKDYGNNITSLYVNGVLVDSKTNNHNALNPTLLPSLVFGSYTGLIDSGFAGKMDEIRIWNYPRSAAQIRTNYYKCLDGNEAGLVAYYHCNDGKGNLLKDATANGNNATLSSATAFIKTDNAPLTTTCYNPTFSNSSKTICFGQSYQTHTITGVYNDTLVNSYGCDSVLTLALTVLPQVMVKKDTIKSCKPVVIGGITYNSNSIATDTIKNSLACDSIYNQHQIIITTTLRDTSFVEICIGKIYLGHNVSGFYNDTAISISGCDSIHTLALVVIQKLHPQLSSDTSICEDDYVNLYPGKFYKYVWNTGSIKQTIQVKTIGSYWVKVSDSLGCTASDSFNLLNIYTKPSNFLPAQISVCSGEEFTLPNYISYNWVNGESTATTTISNYNNYWVNVTDVNGCIGSDTMDVVYLGDEKFEYINAFSPNGDGHNETFKPLNAACVTAFNIIIYNRWGQLVYQSINASAGWSGMHINTKKPVPADVYYFIVTYKNLAGIAKKQSGSVVLLR